MKASIKVLHIAERTTKDNRPYKKVLILITIGKEEFIHTLYCFE